MPDIFGKIPMIGTLYYDEVFLFYDEPQIFSCVSKSFQKYFVILIDSFDQQHEWILTPISEARLIKAKQNSVQIRSIFTEPEDDIIWNIKFKDNFLIELIDISNLTDEMLPYEGEYLDYNDTESSLLKPNEEIAEIVSYKEHRDVIEISLEKDNEHTHEVDCSILSNVLDLTQELIYALANKEGGIKGQTPKSVKQICNLQVSGTFAASFGIRLKSNELCNLHFETPLTPILYELNNLILFADKKEELSNFLSGCNPRVALKYRKLIKTLVSSNIGLKYSSASPNRKSFTRHFTTLELMTNLSLIESEIENMTEIKSMFGKLVGVNTEKRTFVFISVEDETIKGYISDQLSDKTFEVPKDVEIEVKQKIDMNWFTQEEKYTYELLSLKHIIPQNSIKD